MTAQYRSVTVYTYARLHFGFFDLCDHSRRQFGSMGVAIDAFKTEVTIASDVTQSSLDEWTAKLWCHQLSACQVTDTLQLHVTQAIPRHSGLGSGTQMALVLGAGLEYMLGAVPNPDSIARTAGRGGRSGIGVATFQHGGLVVDGGRGKDTTLPPVLARYNFPAQWCFLLIMDHGLTGVHGQTEKQAFQQLQGRPLNETQALAHQILLQGLPALAEQDFASFAEVIGEIQSYNAAYFAPVQGGAYASPSVTRVIAYLKELGHTGLGQSSWGPTGFVMLPDSQSAEALKQCLEARFQALDLQFILTRAINHGATFSAQT